MITFLIFIVFTFYFYLKKKQHFILYIPVFTLVVDILPIFITGFSVDVQNNYTILLSYFRVLIFLMIFVQITIIYKSQIQFNVVYILFAFLLIKPFFTIDPYSSFKTSISVVSFISIFISALTYFCYNKNIYELLKSIRITLFIYLINTLVFTIFKIGAVYYGQALVFQGSVPLFAGYGIVYSMLFLIGNFDRLKKIDWVIIIFSIMVIVALSKRTPMIIFIIGVLILTIVNKKVYFKSKYLLYSLVFFLFVSLAILFSFEQALLYRSRVGQMNIYEEGRYLEYIIIFEEIIKSDDILVTLFGKNLFVEAGTFGLTQNILDVVSDQRRLHSDYAILLFGGGLFALGLYWGFFLRMIKRYYRLYSANSYFENSKAIFISIIIGLFLNGFADSFTVSTARSIPFLYLGALLGQLINYNMLKEL